MSKRLLWLLGSFGCVLILLVGAFVIHAQQRPASVAGTGSQSQKPLYESENEFLPGVIPSPSDKAYAAIDGNHLHEYVDEITAISRRYRDQGHQLWGRIKGTESDAETSRWILEKFRQAGLSNVHAQALDLPPQWMPESWSVTVQGGGKTLHLETAQPTYGTSGTPPEGLDLEAVYVGLGSEADFAGHDVRGKAVFIFSIPLPGMFRNSANVEGGTKRAEEKGAAAIFIVLALPGNVRTQMYSQGTTHTPTFSMGLDDGESVRELIGQAQADRPPHVAVHMDVKMVPDLKTTTEWGELPGTTDENIIILAHRDAWFEGAADNASGMATMVGLAEYFAKIPKEKRRRTITFLGTTGHHETGGTESVLWLAEHKEMFAKTALIENCEHSAAALTYVAPQGIRPTNEENALLWWVGGSAQLRKLVLNAYDEFGVVRYTDPENGPGGEISAIYKFAPAIVLVDNGMLNHSERETADTIPVGGLAASTRAFAKIVTEVNKLDLKDLVATPGVVVSSH